MDCAAVLKLPSTPMQKSLICFTTVCAASVVLPSPASQLSLQFRTDALSNRQLCPN